MNHNSRHPISHFDLTLVRQARPVQDDRPRFRPQPYLRELINPANLPKRYGGELDWEFEHEPSLNEDATGSHNFCGRKGLAAIDIYVIPII
jgi:hypothetical protein